MVDRVKPSKMEIWLGDKIASSKSTQIADHGRADLAAYLARLGRFDESRSLLNLLRQRNENNPQIALSIRIHFAEGLLSYFIGGGVSSADGVQRAYALSAAAGIQGLQALAAAWLAQWDYTNVDFQSLCRHVVESLQLAASDDHASRARANLVVAQVLHLGGRLDLAQAWYSRTKDHATKGFDGATIGALMHNRSWQTMLVLRQALLTNADNSGQGRHALLSAECTGNFDMMIGDSNWQALKPILRAQIFSLMGDSGQALELYEAHLSQDDLPNRWQSNVLADKSWCHAVLGQQDEARACATKAVANLADDTQIDDRAATHSRLAQVFDKFEESDEANRHKTLAESLWKEFSSKLMTAVELLSVIDEDGRAS